MPAGPWIAVCGPGVAGPGERDDAERAGAAVAAAGAVLVCGGLGGVMEAACRGARSGGGMTVGILPGEDRAAANSWVQVAIPTGLGEARNALLVRAADGLVAIGGGWGTLSEIALAMRRGMPVVGVSTWGLESGSRSVEGILQAEDGRQAVDLALAHLRRRGGAES